MRDAWRLLNKAIMKYEAGIIDNAALIKAYGQGEKLVGGVPEKIKI